MEQQVHGKKYSPEEAEKLFRSLVGSWEGTNTTWFEPGMAAESAPVRGTIRQLMDSRNLIYEYESSISGQAHQGVVMYGFNIFSGLFEAAWSDSFHMQTNIMFLQGMAVEGGFSVLGSYLFDREQPAWGWRSQVNLLDSDHLTIMAYNISPDGEEFPAVETSYQRTAE